MEVPFVLGIVLVQSESSDSNPSVPVFQAVIPSWQGVMVEFDAQQGHCAREKFETPQTPRAGGFLVTDPSVWDAGESFSF